MRVISRLRYKQDGEGFWDGRWKQLFVVAADGGAPRQVTRGEHDHVGPGVVAGRTVARLRRKPGTRRGSERRERRLGRAGRRREAGAAADRRPRAGAAAGLGARRDQDRVPRARQRVLGRDAPPGVGRAGVGRGPSVPHAGVRAQHRTSPERRRPCRMPSSGGLTWAPDGGRIYFLVTDGGNTEVASVSTADGQVRLETRGEHELVGCSLDRAARRVACIESDPLSPGEVAVADLGGPAPRAVRRLTRWNAALVDGLALSRPERFECRGADGWPIEGWVMKPAGDRGGRARARGARDSRRAAQHVRQRLHAPVSAAVRRRLRRDLLEPPRQPRLHAGVHRGDPPRLGREGLRGSHARRWTTR